MDFYQDIKNDYQIHFFYNNSILKILVKEKIKKGKKPIKFMTIQILYKDLFSNYFSNFNDLIQQIKEKSILFNLEDISNNKTFGKRLKFELIKNDKNESKIFYSKQIYAFNVKYYLTSGIEHKK